MLTVRLSSDERDLITMAATVNGCDLSNWTRSVLLKEARRFRTKPPKRKTSGGRIVSPEELAAYRADLRPS